jgi:PPOX class probable F420-dependent enzyme
LVPIVFAFDGADLVLAVDSKPKTSRRLARLSNIRRDPRVSVLAHNYAENWDELWWVRVDGIATIADRGPSFDGALAALKSRYPQYESTRIDGPAILIKVDHVNAWRSAGS